MNMCVCACLTFPCLGVSGRHGNGGRWRTVGRRWAGFEALMLLLMQGGRRFQPYHGLCFQPCGADASMLFLVVLTLFDLMAPACPK